MLSANSRGTTLSDSPDLPYTPSSPCTFSSPSTPSSSSAINEEYIQVTHDEILLLLRLRRESADKQTAKEFFNKGLAYLLSLYQNSTDELHWFCNEELNEVATEILYLFSLKVPDECFEEFKKILKEKLINCLECVKIYNRNKRELYER